MLLNILNSKTTLEITKQKWQKIHYKLPYKQNKTFSDV